MTGIIIIATFLAAGLVKGVTGMGLPTVAMGVLGALMSPVMAASLLLLPSLVTNLWQLLSGPSILGTVRHFWPMMIAIFAGTLIGAPFLARGSWAEPALGAVLIVYSLHGLCAPHIVTRAGWEVWLSPLIGLVTGLISGATGIFVIPAVPYLQSLGMTKDGLVQALGLSFTVSTVALAAGLGRNGSLDGAELTTSAMAVVPALAGMWAGQRVRHRIGALAFRRCFLCFLFLLGADLALRQFY